MDTTRIQWGIDSGHLFISWHAAPGHHGATRADVVPARCRTGPFPVFQSDPQGRSSERKTLGGNMRYLRPMTEEAVIAEFLKSEFHHPEFNEYRDAFKDFATTPNFSSRDENTLRRALLFPRRRAMWRGLPPDTEWFEV